MSEHDPRDCERLVWSMGQEIAALRSRLERAEAALRDAFESLDRLKGHRCREQDVFLAHVATIQKTLVAALNPTGEDKEGVIE